MSAIAAPELPVTHPGGARTVGVRQAFAVERRKLSSQLAVRLLALLCLLGPFVFVGVLKIQSGSPTDTLYGVWVHSSGFAVALVILAFSSAWGFPLIAGIAAGDLFSSEDRYGTWKTLLTRSSTRRQVFAGKVLAGMLFVTGLVLLLGIASVAAGVLVIGHGALVGLDGALLSPGHVLALVALSWLWCLAPALAFTGLAVLLSAGTRSGIMGVIGPGIATLIMQLLLLVGTGFIAHALLLSFAFDAWHPLLRPHPYLRPLLVGAGVSLVWCAVCLALAWRLVSRRDFAGAPVARRQGWVGPVRVVVALAAVVALWAVAGSWGPVGVTPSRLQASLTPEFNRLTLLQQHELGRQVPAGARLNILPSCSRRGSTPNGPGDWVCTLNVILPSAGAVPFQQTPVSYDVSVQPDGCYKAQSPPAFIGQQLMRDAFGHNVVNPLYTIYGCLNLMR